uniref:Uncharacterized protein n=1 Tax=Anguilla anguilla TaxID=7936 RepID=A0A0E9SQ08_ANGAN
MWRMGECHRIRNPERSWTLGLRTLSRRRVKAKTDGGQNLYLFTQTKMLSTGQFSQRRPEREFSSQTLWD